MFPCFKIWKMTFDHPVGLSPSQIVMCIIKDHDPVSKEYYFSFYTHKHTHINTLSLLRVLLKKQHSLDPFLSFFPFFIIFGQIFASKSKIWIYLSAYNIRKVI